MRLPSESPAAGKATGLFSDLAIRFGRQAERPTARSLDVNRQKLLSFSAPPYKARPLAAWPESEVLALFGGIRSVPPRAGIVAPVASAKSGSLSASLASSSAPLATIRSLAASRLLRRFMSQPCHQRSCAS
jgi:hypothetical protein